MHRCSKIALLLAILMNVHLPAQDDVVSPDAEKVLSALISKVQSSKAITTEFKTNEQVFSNDQVVFEQKTDYSSASQLPNLFALRVRSDQINADIVSDGKTMNLLISPEAYIQIDAPKSLAEVTEQKGMPSGPIIDALLALTVPTDDVRARLLKGVSKVTLDPKAKDGKESVLLFENEDLTVLKIGVDDSDDLAITSMGVDMTEMIKKENPQVRETPGFRFVVSVSIDRWQWAEGDDKTFAFDPPKDAKAFASIEALVKGMTDRPHPLLGKEAPDFEVALLNDKKIKLSQHRDKNIVILDFWATWCGPCRIAMPVISEVATKFEKKGVVLYAVNNGETKDEIRQFLDESKLPITVARDEDAEIAESYYVTGLPMTVLIGKDGRVETVHLGFQSLESLREQLTSELEVLVEGGHLEGSE